MNEQQLRELIRVIGKAGLMRVVGQMLRGRQGDPAQADESAPTGLRKFLPWNRESAEGSRSIDDREPLEDNTQDGMTSRERADLRVDDIIRSVMGGGDQRPEDKPQQRPEDALKATLSGAIERQDGVDSGQRPPVQQLETPGGAESPSGSANERPEPSRASNAMDAVQLGLDVVGAFDPTPIVDGINAAISVGRAFVTDPERRKEHLQNAAISTVSMIPYVGDTAKLAKVPRAAKTVQRTTQAVRGADRAADGTKAMTATQKRASREQYRDTAQQVSSAAGGQDSQAGMQDTAAQQNAGGGNGGSRVPPSSLGAPDSGDGRNVGLSQAREEAEGIAEHDAWQDKLKAAGGKLAEFAGILGKGATKAAAFVTGLSLLNTGVIALNRDLAQYNGGLASAYAQSDAADIQRDARRGQALSGSLSGLIEQQSALKDNLQELTIPLQTLGIKLLTEVTRLTNDALNFMNVVIDLIPGARQALDLLNKQNPDDGTAWMQFLQDVSDGKFDGKRPDFLGKNPQILNDQDHKDVFGP